MAERERTASFDGGVRASSEEEPFEEFADAALGNRIKTAYDQVALPEDSFERMLTALAAQQGAVPEPDCVVKRKPHVLHYALPIAACLAVAAIAGIIAFNAPVHTSESADLVDMEAAFEESVAESDKEDASAAGEPSSSGEAPEEAAEESSDVGGGMNGESQAFDGEGPDSDASAPSLAYQSPIITLASGDELRVATDAQGNPQEADAADIVRYLEDATARAEGSDQESVACAIYVVANGSYAVTFEGDSAYYLLQA